MIDKLVSRSNLLERDRKSVETMGWIEAPTQYLREPDPNLISDSLGKLIYDLGGVTRESGHFRTLADRSTRKEILNKTGPNRTDNKILLDEGYGRDEISRQYLNQGRVCVKLDKLGVQSAPYAIIEPPKDRIDPKYGGQPVVIIPGISNGLNGIEPLIKELAYQGRTVIAVAQPESFRGEVTESFVMAVENSKDLTPHIEFFKRAVLLIVSEWYKKYFANNDSNPPLKFDLVGHSTGCAVIAGMLDEQIVQQCTANAVLVSPAAVVDQSAFSFDWANVPEIWRLLTRDINKLPKVSRNNEKQSKLKSRVTQGVKENILRFQKRLYEKVTLTSGGKILVLSGENDEIVKSYRAEEALKKLNPKMEIIHLEDAAHAEALTHPERIVKVIKHLLNSEGISR